MTESNEHTAGSTGASYLSEADTRLMRQVIDDVLASANPLTAMARLMAKSQAPHATAFERYAGMALRDAGCGQLVNRATPLPVRFDDLGVDGLARLTCNTPLDAQDARVLENVEDTLNRLRRMAEALEDNAALQAPQSAGILSVSIIGGVFRAEKPPTDNAAVSLPAIGMREQPGVEYLNEVDWTLLDQVAAHARAVFQSSLLPNMHQSFMGSYAPKGSDWDIRTRLAAILEKLEPVPRVNCSFDCNVPASLVAVRFAMPAVESLPQRLCDSAGALREAGDVLESARMAYALRLACLLAAACFGAGRRIEHALVQATGDGKPAFACSFNRHDFVHETLVAITSGKLGSPLLRFDPEAVARAATPESLVLGEWGRTPSVNEPATRIPPHEDTRALPPKLEQLFHARRICDIDTRHYFGGNERVIEDARLDSEESILAAIASLEDAVAELEASLAPPDDDGNARPLYCSNPLSRATVSLLDDDYAISLQAEAYLKGIGDLDDVADNLPHYFRAPHALFQAHVGLSDLYARLGDFRGAELEADRGIALAPTTAQAYYRKADVLAQQDRFAEAANVLVSGLRCAVSERDCALLYYHLGLVLWRLGRERDAAAVHVYAMSLNGEHAEKSAAVVRSLRKRPGSPVITHASPLAAAREMAKARIPVAPSDNARTLIVHAAIGLSCADAPEACAPYASAIARYFRNDPIIAAAARSIQHGLE